MTQPLSELLKEKLKFDIDVMPVTEHEAVVAKLKAEIKELNAAIEYFKDQMQVFRNREKGKNEPR